MSEPGDGDIFDLEQLKRLIELMEEHDLGEVELENAGRRVRLQRGGVAPLSAPAPLVAAAPAVAATESAAEPDHIVYIRSPMVGSFYSKPNPDSPSYVKIGDHVDPETTVCMVEAMKNFIPIMHIILLCLDP